MIFVAGLDQRQRLQYMSVVMQTQRMAPDLFSLRLRTIRTILNVDENVNVDVNDITVPKHLNFFSGTLQISL